MEAKTKSRNRDAGPWQLAVVDDNPAIHAAVREHLQLAGELWQVSAYDNGRGALKVMADGPPDAMLMQQTLSDGCGLEWAGRLKSRLPDLPVIIHARKGSPEKLLKALSIEALGYVVIADGKVAWATHLRKAMEGRFTMCEQAERWLPQVLGGMQMAGEHWNLSPREQDVMLCLCRHTRKTDISIVLGISEATVHAHLAKIYKKLGVHDRQSAIRTFTQKWLGGGKMAGREFSMTRPFLDFLHYCVPVESQVECDRKHDGRTRQPQ